MKKLLSVFTILFLVGCTHTPCKKHAVFQNAPSNALLAGCYTGTMSVHDLKKHGDFGLGTFDSIDGEMVVLDHVFYQIQPDGKAQHVSDEAMSPFATLTFFKAGQEFFPMQSMEYKELTRFLDEKIPSPNLFYAIKVKGKFPMAKLRSATRQEKPYRVLTEAIKEQKVFELKKQEGTLVGFRFPSYMKGVNVSGYHFHFLTRDKTSGGHVLDLRIEEPHIEIDTVQDFSMKLPEDDEFLRFQFSSDPEQALDKVEK